LSETQVQIIKEHMSLAAKKVTTTSIAATTTTFFDKPVKVEPNVMKLHTILTC